METKAIVLYRSKFSSIEFSPSFDVKYGISILDIKEKKHSLVKSNLREKNPSELEGELTSTLGFYRIYLDKVRN